MKHLRSAIIHTFLLTAAAQAAPVTGWLVVNPSTGGSTTKPISGAHTSSPVLGNGSEDSASQVAMYANIAGPHDLAPDIQLANGERVTLSGSATLFDISSSQEQFRWGLFNESVGPIDASSWAGFIASNSNDFSGGALRAKPAESGTFAQTGSAVNLRTEQDGDSFIDETYFFTMSVSRFNNEVSIDASLTSADDWSQKWTNVIPGPTAPQTFNFNRVGFLSGDPLNANRITFSNIDVTKESIPTLTLQVITTGPDAGAVQIRNDRSESFEIDYYEIKSAAASLNSAGWNGLDAQEGADPQLAGWIESAGNSSKLLSEYRLFSSVSVNPSTSLSLGHAFNVGGQQDLEFYFGLADGTLARGIVDYIASPDLAGDYNDDGVVTAADYILWRMSEGANDLLPNDPTGGTIGPIQYSRWSASFGNSTATATNPQAASAIPEPDTACVAVFAVFLALMWRIN